MPVLNNPFDCCCCRCCCRYSSSKWQSLYELEIECWLVAMMIARSRYKRSCTKCQHVKIERSSATGSVFPCQVSWTDNCANQNTINVTIRTIQTFRALISSFSTRASSSNASAVGHFKQATPLAALMSCNNSSLGWPNEEQWNRWPRSWEWFLSTLFILSIFQIGKVHTLLWVTQITKKNRLWEANKHKLPCPCRHSNHFLVNCNDDDEWINCKGATTTSPLLLSQ